MRMCEMEFNEKQLLNLTFTLILDYFRYIRRFELKDEDISVYDVRNYCRAWIKENLKESLPQKDV